MKKKKLIIHEINTLEMRSVPSLSSIVGTGDSILHFELYYRGASFKVQGFGTWVFFGPKLRKRAVR